MKIKNIIQSTVWYGLISRISSILNIITLPFLTPYLTSFDYGMHGIITSYTGILFSISLFGLNTHLTNSFYTHKSKYFLVWSRMLSLILVSSLIAAIILGFVLYFSLNLTPEKKNYVIIIAIIPLLFQFNNIFINHYFPLVYKPKVLAYRSLIANLISFIAVVILIRSFKLGFFGWLIGMAILSISEFLLFYRIFWIRERIFPNFNIKLTRLKKWLSISVYLIPHTLGFVLLSTSDRLVMKWLNVSVDEIGIYSLGYTMGSYIFIISTAMITSISPRIQELYRAKLFYSLRKLFEFTQITTAVIILLFVIWLPDIFKILIHNANLNQSIIIGVIVAFSYVVYPFYAIISAPAFIEEKTSKLLWLVIFPGLINVVLNFSLIPLYGFKIAVYTTLVSYWMQLLIARSNHYFSNKIELIFGDKNYIFMLLIGYVILFFLSLLLYKTSFILKTIFSFFILFFFIYSITKKIIYV